MFFKKIEKKNEIKTKQFTFINHDPTDKNNVSHTF